jgi:hypothetical protein
VKEIGPIYLSWRKGQGERRHIVGVLKKNATEGVRFSYITKGVEAAKKEGFTSYAEFSDIDKKYSDNVIDIFGQRLIKSERADISDFYDFWEVDTTYKDDKYYLLAHTQGLIPTDNFEFLVDYNHIKSLRFLTDLAGLSILSLPAGTLSIGDVLSYELEKENPKDKEAVKVFKGDTHVGYIKKVHCKVFHKRGAKRLKLTVKAIEQNGVVKRAFVKVAATDS